MTVAKDELEELREAEQAVANNHRTPDQLKDMKTSSLVVRISSFAIELNTWRLQAPPEVQEEMKKNEPEMFELMMKMINGTTKDLAMSSHELDLRIPDGHMRNDDII